MAKITGYTYAWLRDGKAIPGATARTYTLTAADDTTALGCQVTATNLAGSTSATANAPFPTVSAVPVNRAAPSFSFPWYSSQSVRVGSVVKCERGEWDRAYLGFDTSG